MSVARTMIVLAITTGMLLGSGGALAQFGVPITDPAPLNSNAATDSGSDATPRIVADCAGNWVAVWVSQDSLNGTIGTDVDILVTRSTDNGVSWSAPAPLNSNAVTNDGNPVGGLEIATDCSGNWVVVWGSTDSLGGTIGSDTDILFARSTDNGATWTALAALNTNAGTDSEADNFPQIATDRTGNWVAIWRSDNPLGDTIGFDQDILVSHSLDNGLSWTSPLPLNSNSATDSGDDFPSHVAADGSGNWIAVWSSFDTLGGQIGIDGDILVARSTDNGTNWTAPVPLNTNAGSDAGDDFGARIAQDGASNWVVVWDSLDELGGTIGTDHDIFVAHSTDNGLNWTAPVPLNTNAGADVGNDFGARIAPDGTGNWVTVWFSADSLGGIIGPDFDILIARSTDSGMSWTAPTPLNTNAVFASTDDRNPGISTDGMGNWVSVWNSNNSLGGDIGQDRDILLTRFALGICGNSVVEPPEECDDGNSIDGDGCSFTCTVESGYVCTGEPSTCTQPIPAVSQWGLMVMALLVLVAGVIVIRRPARV